MISETYLPDVLPRPVAAADGLDEPYWSGLTEHVLCVQCCENCGTFQWGPEVLCHSCGEWDPAWVQIEPRGEIFSYERVWHPVDESLKDACPYIVVLVSIPHAGGIRLLGNLLGDRLQDVTIGDPVEGVFEDHPGENAFTLLQWAVVDS